MNSYQRLKQKNEKLRKEYAELFAQFVKVIEDPDSDESLSIKHKILMENSVVKVWAFGTRNGLTTTGLLEQIN